MNPILLQQQLKNNNKDLLDFRRDLKSWGEDMQKKEPKSQPERKKSDGDRLKPSDLIKNKEGIHKKKYVEHTQPKRKCMTYADWEKFDADKECDEVDDSDSELTDEFDGSMREQALNQKDMGNIFVKNGKWDQAIKCYTEAIEYFAYDPVFYANRALCYLKKNEMVKVESDCTISLKLDNTYVKAYQRRAVARESMNRLDDAKCDLLRVLQFEPKNIESKNHLEKLNEKMKSSEFSKISTNSNRPVSKFTASRQQMKSASLSISDNAIDPEKRKIDVEKPATLWPSGDNVAVVKAIKKPPHLRSKKPLKRIVINEINSVKPESPVNEKNVSSWPRIDNVAKNIKSDEFKIIEHKLKNEGDNYIQTAKDDGKIICVPEKEAKNGDNCNVFFKEKEEIIPSIKKLEVEELVSPNTSVQFHSMWKRLKDSNEKKSEYLRMMNPRSIPELFKESLESQIFSEILLILASYFIGENDRVYEYLLYLTNIKRFGALCMFLTLNDKNCLWKMFNRIKECEGKSKEVDELIKKYEL